MPRESGGHPVGVPTGGGAEGIVMNKQPIRKTHCKCGRYLSSDGKPCFCAPWYRRALWAVGEWHVRRGRKRRIDRHVMALFMRSQSI